MTTDKNVEDRIQKLLDCLNDTQEDEADCIDFDLQAHCLAESLARGYPASVIPPDIKAHLQHSNDCREELEALVAIIEAELAGELPPEEE
jgi:hypothetical protein